MPRRSNRQGTTIGGALIVLLLLVGAIFFPDLINSGTGTPTTESPTELATQLLPPQDTAVVPPGSTEAVTPVSTEPQLPAWLTVYFTNPNPPDDVNNGIDRYVVADINAAQQTIDVTSFDLNLPSFVNALVAAQQRGVQVRVVYDGKNGEQVLDAARTADGKDFETVAVMQAAGIGLVNDGRSNGLMHDKMIIIDSQILYMGSWNMSYNDTFRNNNNLLRITDPTLIANYQAKFNELFVDGNFGTHAVVGAQTQVLTIDGVSVANYFSPVDNVMDKLVALVGQAQRSIRFFIFTYTDQNLANAMIERYQAGVDVQGVIENRGASQGALVPLFCAKVPVKTDGNKYTMHHKVIVIDEHLVITGSFNFTKSADTANDDNVLIIDDPALARLYLDEFDRMSGIAKTPDPAGFTCP